MTFSILLRSAAIVIFLYFSVTSDSPVESLLWVSNVGYLITCWILSHNEKKLREEIETHELTIQLLSQALQQEAAVLNQGISEVEKNTC